MIRPPQGFQQILSILNVHIRLKHLAMLEEINTTTTPKFYISYNDDFNNQDDDYGVSTTFNVADLTAYFGLEES